jgi:hypothetical protein
MVEESSDDLWLKGLPPPKLKIKEANGQIFCCKNCEIIGDKNSRKCKNFFEYNKEFRFQQLGALH